MKNPDLLIADAETNALDSLKTAAFLLAREDEFKWKWLAVAVHHSLYSFGIAALGDGIPAWVSKNFGDDAKILKFWDDTWKKSKKVPVDGCVSAYRIEWEVVNLERPQKPPDIKDMPLIGFWTTLARIQNEKWMNSKYMMKPVVITDAQFKRIEWLADGVRNKFIHFVPGHYEISISDIKTSCLDAIMVIEALVFESGDSLWRIEKNQRDEIRQTIEILRERLRI